MLKSRKESGENLKEGFYELKWQSQNALVTLEYDLMEEESILSLMSAQLAMEVHRMAQEKQAEKAVGDF